MRFERVGSRGFLFAFDEPYATNVYVVAAPRNVYMLDTFLGPEPMRGVKACLAAEGVSGRPFVAFNSHADYDHYWGNQEFAGGWIVAHDSALRRVQQQGSESLRDYGRYAMGEVTITPPNLLFRKRLTLPLDGVEFIHTPGHTGDSASCWDSVDRVLYAGDNVESPFPQVNLLNLKDWQASLEECLRLGPEVVVSGHDPPSDTSLLRGILEYLKGLQSLRVPRDSWDEPRRLAHLRNLRRIGGLYAERGDPKKATEYLQEALATLDEMEPTPENRSRRARIEESLTSSKPETK